MTTLSRQDLARSDTLEELYGKLDKVGMGPGWNKPTPSLWAAPRKTLVPAHWAYEQARGALDAAGRLINTALAERRNLILVNPAEGNTYRTTRTLVAAYQMTRPGERALAPDWSAHGHGNDSKACAFWLDFLDAPLVQLLEPMFFEHFEEEGDEAFEAEPAAPTTDSPFVFTWKETLARLADAPPEPDGPFGTQIELRGPPLETPARYRR